MVSGTPWDSHARFPDTRWSLVRSAATGSSRALEELCEAYAGPVYAYFRRKGHDSDEATDLAQDFFATKILDPARREAVLRDDDHLFVRFRSFLRTCLKNFDLTARTRQGAQKRGGGATVLSIDVAAVERSLALVEDQEPWKVFDVSWARCVVDRVFKQLQDEISSDARVVLRRTLQCTPDRKVADELGVSPNAVAKTRKRTLDRARRLLNQELQETVVAAADLQEELRELGRVYTLPAWLTAG